MKTLKGADISHWQPKVEWTKVKLDFMVHKCTEGTAYLDPKYKERKKHIQGSYHFASGGDPVKEAEWYVKNSNEPFLCLDWEIEHSDPVGWCKKFITVVEQMTGKTCWFYTNDARACGYYWPNNWKFWIARYADYTGKYYPDFHPNFKNWSIHQYTSRGKVDGIEGNVDLNICKDLDAFKSPASEPEPEVAPDVPQEPEKPTETTETPQNEFPQGGSYTATPVLPENYTTEKNWLQRLIEKLIEIIIKWQQK